MHPLLPFLTISLLTPLLFLTPGMSQDNASKDPLEAYPAAAEGQTRHVFPLPEEEDESQLQLEIIVGEVHEVDQVNRYLLAGTIEEKTIPGWGYSYHLVEKLGPMMGTLMAPPPGAEKAKRFIPLRGEPYLVRYNSKLPVVVYVPKGAEVRFRIWKAGETRTMEEG